MNIRRGLSIPRSGDHEEVGGNELFDLFFGAHGQWMLNDIFRRITISKRGTKRRGVRWDETQNNPWTAANTKHNSLILPSKATIVLSKLWAVRSVMGEAMGAEEDDVLMLCWLLDTAFPRVSKRPLQMSVEGFVTAIKWGEMVTPQRSFELFWENSVTTSPLHVDDRWGVGEDRGAACDVSARS